MCTVNPFRQLIIEDPDNFKDKVTEVVQQVRITEEAIEDLLEAEVTPDTLKTLRRYIHLKLQSTED